MRELTKEWILKAENDYLVAVRERIIKNLAEILAAFLLVCTAGSAGAVDISTFSAAGCGFPGTAQSVCYDNTGAIACPASGAAFYGQDAQYANSASTMSFTIYNGATWGGTATSSVTVDNRTGLMWATNPDDSCATCPGGFVSSGTYTWEPAIARCEGLTYAGFADWRLPNVKELVSIVDYSQLSPSINRAYFLNTQSEYYWSSTTLVAYTPAALIVYFVNGFIFSNNKTGSFYVRCVRGGP